MDKQKNIQRLERHIEALECSYDNVIELLNEDLERETGDDTENEGKSTLKDTQKKIYAEGVLKNMEASRELLLEIETFTAKLEKLKNPTQQKKKEEEKKVEENHTSDLNSRLS